MSGRGFRVLHVYHVDQETGAETREPDVRLIDWIDANQESEDRAAVQDMKPGDRLWIGGGAAPLFLLFCHQA